MLELIVSIYHKVEIGELDLHIILRTESMPSSDIEFFWKGRENIFKNVLIEENWQMGIPITISLVDSKL